MILAQEKKVFILRKESFKKHSNLQKNKLIALDNCSIFTGEFFGQFHSQTFIYVHNRPFIILALEKKVFIWRKESFKKHSNLQKSKLIALDNCSIFTGEMFWPIPFLNFYI